ncbi:unnamed protein product [Alternaria alternata]
MSAIAEAGEDKAEAVVTTADGAATIGRLEAEKAETKTAYPTGTPATAHLLKGPRNPGKPPVYGLNAARPPTGPRSSAPSAIKKEEAEADEDEPDVKMADTR